MSHPEEIPSFAPEGWEIRDKILISRSTGQQYNIKYWVDSDNDVKVKKKGEAKVEELLRIVQEVINE